VTGVPAAVIEISWSTHLTTSDFWNRTLQNWQSEFLAVGSMVILSVFLRQRGSPESKPVGAPHAETASSGWWMWPEVLRGLPGCPAVI